MSYHMGIEEELGATVAVTAATPTQPGQSLDFMAIPQLQLLKAGSFQQPAPVSTLAKVAVVGALAGGAYLLYRHFKKGKSTP